MPRAAVVFVPGFMQRGDSWAPVAERVAESYPTVCLDFATHSLEPRLAELRQAAPRGSAVVGYSMGGRLALYAAAREPGWFAALATVGAGAGIDDPGEREERAIRDAALAAWMETVPIEDVVDRWEAEPVFSTQSRELREAQRPGRLSHEPPLLAALLRSAGQGAMDPFWRTLDRIDIPVLAVAGERDEAYMTAARRIALLASRAEARPVFGAGHAAHMEAPDAFSDLLLEFLDQHLGQHGVAD